MNHACRWRVWAYGLVVLALCSITYAVPRAWATPTQAHSGQGITVPTPTPVRVWTPSPQPEGETPVAPSGGGATPVFGSPVPEWTAVPAPTAVRTFTGAILSLTQDVAPFLAWPGVTVEYILTLKNTGTASARQVVLEDMLPDGLDPVALYSPGAAWEGRNLRAQIPLLPPGGQVQIMFDVRVRDDAMQGGLLINSAQAAAAGLATVHSDAAIALPPITLPIVGAVLGSASAAPGRHGD